MSLGTAAAVAGAVAAVASAGVGAATAAGAFDSDGGAGPGGMPLVKPLKAFAPATGLQGWSARLLAKNVDAKPPTLDQWINSDATASFDLDIPDFTPKEAEQLRLVDKRGGEIPYYKEGQGALTDEQIMAMGEDRSRRRRMGDLGDNAPVTSEEKFVRATRRENRLRGLLEEANLAPRREARVNRQLARVEDKLAMLRNKRS